MQLINSPGPNLEGVTTTDKTSLKRPADMDYGSALVWGRTEGWQQLGGG